MERTVKPARLKIGDTVGIISPSAPITPNLRDQFDTGVKTLESFGFKVKLGKHVFDQYYYSAGTRNARIEDFNAMWKDPEVKMILMSQGGTTANHLLGGIDYEMIQKAPKIIAGISDGTTLLNAIYAKTGLITYHGPDLLWMFGRRITEPFRDNFIKTFFDGRVGKLAPNPKWEHQVNPSLTHHGWTCVRSGKATGSLVGGHCSSLSNTMLAGYGADFKNSILFLEGTEDISRIDRQLTSLELSGVFGIISGLIIGWFEGIDLEDKDQNRSVRDMVLEVTRNYSFPILEIGELGHSVENYVLPIGCATTIDAGRKIPVY